MDLERIMLSEISQTEDTFHLQVKWIKQNKRRNKTHKLKGTEKKLMFINEREAEGPGEEAKGLKEVNWQLQNHHRDVQYNLENIAKNTVKVCLEAGGCRPYWGNHSVRERTAAARKLPYL